MSMQYYSQKKYINNSIYGSSDPYFAKVVALLHMDGTNASTTIIDSSASPKNFTANGAQISTAQSKFGGASAVFDGSSYFINSADNADWDLGTGDFTMEAWIRTNTVAAGQGLIVARQEGGSNHVIQFRRNGSDIDFITRDTGGANLLVVTASAAISANTWHHVAASRNGSTLRLFVDGDLKNSGTISNTLNCSEALTIGALYDGIYSSYFNGYIDDVRITKSIGRYTASFTPPIAAFLNR